MSTNKPKHTPIEVSKLESSRYGGLTCPKCGRGNAMLDEMFIRHDLYKVGQVCSKDRVFKCRDCGALAVIRCKAGDHGEWDTCERAQKAAPIAPTDTHAKHTPGPWQRVVSRGSSAAYTRVGAGDYGAIAECGGCRPSQEENAANARLIAAAPELFEACERGVAVLRDGATLPQLEAWAAYASAAIAKAHGEGK